MKSEEYPKQLLESYKGRQLVAVVGAGFTSATSPGSSGSSWPELIKSGASALTEKPKWAENAGKIVMQILDDTAYSDNTMLLLNAASMVRQGFESDGPQPFANFLHDNVGELATVIASWARQ